MSGGRDPGARLRGLRRRELLHRAGHQEAEKLHGVLDPFDIGDERDTLDGCGIDIITQPAIARA